MTASRTGEADAADGAYRRGVVGLMLALAAGCTYVAFFGGEWGFDDAYISYRYAGNLLDGHGLVFNPGERVEGYTNFLYVLLMALGMIIVPREAVYAFSVIVNITFLLLALWMLLAHLRPRVGSARTLVAGALVALCPPLWIAAHGGMETCLVVLGFVGVFVAIREIEEEGSQQPIGRLAFFLALTLLARADGFVIALLALLHLAMWGRMRVALVGAGLSACVFGTHVLGRLAYYGYPLPNTFYAKVSGDVPDRIANAWVLAQTFIEPWPVVVLIACGVWLRRRRGASNLRALDFGSFFAFAWLGYWFYVGGDVFEMRFLLVLFVVGAAALAEILPPRLPSARGPRRGYAALVLLLLAIPLVSHDFRLERTQYDRWIALGRFLRWRHPDALIAVDATGKIPYFSGLRSIDMLGLNDVHLAHREFDFTKPGHSKFDPEYIYAREPDLIAAWVADPAFGLTWGLDAREYRRRGYRLAYLVHQGPNPPGEPIVDVRGLNARERLRLTQDRYLYGVLERVRAAE